MIMAFSLSMTKIAQQRVLLVDDQTEITGLLSVLLRKNGYTVLAQNDPKKALETAQDFNPDIVLLDVEMPELDGGDVAAQLAEDPFLQDTPVVFLTSLVTHKEAEKQSQFGGYPFLAKPTRLTDLLECLKTTLSTASRNKSDWAHLFEPAETADQGLATGAISG